MIDTHAHVFKEYYKNPEATSKAKFMRDGKVYFKTGTLGFIDEDGYFTLTGRDSRFYIMSSLNKVYCDRVQMLISYIDCVKDCAVVKVPDEEQLYVNKAYVVLNDGYIPNESLKHDLELKFYSPIETLTGDKEQLKTYEIPSYIEFISELPRKQGTDKVDYSILEEDAKNKLDSNKKYLKK